MTGEGSPPPRWLLRAVDGLAGRIFLALAAATLALIVVGVAATWIFGVPAGGGDDEFSAYPNLHYFVSAVVLLLLFAAVTVVALPAHLLLCAAGLHVWWAYVVTGAALGLGFGVVALDGGGPSLRAVAGLTLFAIPAVAGSAAALTFWIVYRPDRL